MYKNQKISLAQRHSHWCLQSREYILVLSTYVLDICDIKFCVVVSAVLLKGEKMDHQANTSLKVDMVQDDKLSESASSQMPDGEINSTGEKMCAWFFFKIVYILPCPETDGKTVSSLEKECPEAVEKLSTNEVRSRKPSPPKKLLLRRALFSDEDQKATFEKDADAGKKGTFFL